jgi:selenoprotein W-related protein
MTSLTLIPDDKGIFDVTVNGTRIFSKHEMGRHAQPGEVLSAFKKMTD